MTLVPGSSLGPYQIEVLAGAGAMGEVYRARDTRLNRTVAIKILPAHVAAVPGLLQRFEREARAIAAVEHTNICPLYDVGADNGVNFLVMQFVEGETLADRISRGPIPVREAIALAQQIAAGLDAAHAHGVVHRDLKPSNIRLTTDRQVRLVDFGLAKAMSPLVSSDPDASPTVTASPSEAGVILGTAAYMSPEQARGQTVDRRTDIWAFGGVLFEMLTGRRPFAGGTLADVFAAVVNRDPDWNALPPETPRRIRDLLRRCLEKDQPRRLRDIGDARLDLDDAVREAAEPSAPSAAAPRRGAAIIPWVVAALALTFAAAAVIFPWRTAGPETPSQMRFSGVTNFTGAEGQPSFSPDGRSVAFVSNRDGQWDLYTGLVTGGSLIRLTNDPNVESTPRWSPDGTKLLFARLNDTGLHDMWVTPALPGTARRLVLNAQTPAWSPDGRAIAYSSESAIWMCDATGANPRAVTKREPAPIMHYQPAFARSGRSIAFVRRRRGPRSELALVDPETQAVRFLTSDDALAMSPVWSPDDRFLYFSSSRGGTINVWRMSVADGHATPITAGQGDDIEIDLSADGNRLVFATYRANTNLAEIPIAPAPPGPLKWLTSDAARSEAAPTYAPDGGRIAYFSNRSGAEREAIWVMDADGANATRLVEDGRINIHPRWSPDGQSLFFLSRAPGSLQGDSDIRLIALAGGAPQLLPLKPYFPEWGWGDVATDGRLLYRTSERAGELYDPRAKRREAVPDLPSDPRWSPDARRFAFAVRDDMADVAAGLWVHGPDGVRRQLFKGWVVWFTWMRTGDLLVLEGRPDFKAVLWRISPDGRRTVALDKVPIFRRPVDGTWWYVRFDVHPDGRRIVIEALESYEADIGMIDNVKGK
ncbi:MAG TPA: protein kinase [Vicinamibacterales bacterium]|nr:protein kinase [Vicinamibacterales bacterium]